MTPPHPTLSRAISSFQQLWRKSSYHTESIYLAWIVSILVALASYQEIVLIFGINGCDRETLGSSNACKEIVTWAVYFPSAVKQVLVYCGAAVFATLKLRKIVMYQNILSLDVDQGSKLKSHRHLRLLVSGHWTAAASSDIFLETLELISDAQALSFLLVALTTFFVLVSQVKNAARNSTTSPGPDHALLSKACCSEGVACSDLCTRGVTYRDTFVTALTGMLVLLLAWSCVLPLELWSPATRTAAKKTGNGMLSRVLVLPRVFVAAAFLVGICFGLVVLSNVYPSAVAHEWLWTGFFFAAALASGVLLLVILWAFHWPGLVSLARSARWQLVVVWNSIACAGGMQVAPELSQPQTNSLPFFWQCRQSCRYRKVVLLCCCAYCFAIEALSEFPPEIWVVRAAMLILLLVSRDEPCSFDLLETHGAGFGLVVDARQLRAALRGHLGGAPISGRVRRYKATLLRMQDTLAVSYRWQPDAVPLAEDLDLNMSGWQMASLADAIEQSRCLYVWVDRSSVPSDGGELKRILLSRMLSVYSTAFLTLVLLSREQEKGSGRGRCRSSAQESS